MSASWLQLGERIAAARSASGFTQSELAAAIDLDRTAVSKIETGDRKVDAVELSRIAERLGRPISWFLATPLPSVISRRNARGVEVAADIQLETLANDVEQLVDLGLLSLVALGPLGVTVDSVEAAETAAVEVRQHLQQPDGELVDLTRVAERLGLLVFMQSLGKEVEGSYVALRTGGVALVGADAPSGRRRFTIAHELGHHVLADEYSSAWLASDHDDRERLINAFAIHLLVPRLAIDRCWPQLDGPEDPWNAAIHLAATYAVSWSALCAHLRNLRFIDEATRSDLAARPPAKGDFLERMLALPADVSPALPPSFEAAVIKGYRRRLIGRERALELLRGTLQADDLPSQHAVPLDAMVDEFGPL